MSEEKYKEIEEKVRTGALDRPALIKTLRKLRMKAIGEKDQKVLDLLKDPVEVVADRMIAALRV